MPSTSSTPPATRTWLDRAGWILLCTGVLAWPAAWLVDAGFGREVTLLRRVRTADEQAAWRRGHAHDAGRIAWIYGVVEPPEDVRVLVFHEARLIVPSEDRSLGLLPLAEGGVIVRSRTFRFAAAALALALGLLGGGLVFVARRRAAGNPGPA